MTPRERGKRRGFGLLSVALGSGLLLACLSLEATAADPARAYASYYAARDAMERGDCRAVVRHLEDFLREHQYVREKYPDFYAEVRYGIAQCSGGLTVRGAGGDSSNLDPLPDDPPMAE